MAEAARADGPTAAWRPVSAWHGIVAAGRDGRPDGAAGLTIERIDPASLVLVAALDGKATAVRDRMTERLGLSPPETPRIVSTDGLDLIWFGRAQWLARATEPGLAARLGPELAGLAAVTEATGSRGIVRVSGPALAGVLAKGVNLDLHPDAFPDGTAAVTAIAHMSVHLWRIGDSFELSIARSFAGSFWSWLSASAAEYGCEVR